MTIKRNTYIEIYVAQREITFQAQQLNIDRSLKEKEIFRLHKKLFAHKSN